MGKVPDCSRSETKSRCAAVLETIHYVIKGEKILRRVGVEVDVVPVPREISSDCGMALEFFCRDRDRVEQLLAEEDITVVGIYSLHRSREWRW